MDRGDVRTAALGLRSWHADVDDAFVEDVNTLCIDPAAKRLASEVPEALLPEDETVVVLTQKTSASLGRTLAVTTDAYVLSFGLDTLPGGKPIAVDHTWDGLFWLEVTGKDGKIIRRQCREFWLQAAGLYKDHYLVSLDRPWANTSDTGLAFRLYQPFVYTRDDVMQVLDGRVYDSSRQVVGLLPAAAVRRRQVEDFQGLSVGTPKALVRTSKVQLDTPNRPPVASAYVASNWSTTQEPPGTFVYCYTYVWGMKGADFTAPGGSFDPVWESAPGPVSNTLTSVYPASVKLTELTNIAWQKKFDPIPVAVRSGRTGWRKRIYRKRLAVAAGGTTVQNVEFPGIFFFLDEVEDDVTSYVDDGTKIPDYDRRLPESHGYWSLAPVPQPDKDYEIDLRVLRRPKALANDSDVLPFDVAFEDMFLLLVLHYLCKMDKDPEASADYERQYKERVEAFRAAQTSSSDYIPGEVWTPSVPANTQDLFQYRLQ